MIQKYCSHIIMLCLLANSLSTHSFAFDPKKIDLAIDKKSIKSSILKSNYLLKYFRSKADKEYFNKNLSTFDFNNISQKAEITTEGKSIHITNNGSKISLTQIDLDQKSFILNGTQFILKEQSLESLVSKMLLAINEKSKSTRFFSYIIDEAYAIEPLTVAITTLIITALTYIVKSIIQWNYTTDLETNLSTCTHREDQIPYKESYAFKLFEKNSVKWGFDFDQFRNVDCVQYAKDNNKEYILYSRNELLKHCQLTRDLIHCIDKSSNHSAQKNNSRDLIPDKETPNTTTKPSNPIEVNPQ